MTEDKPGEVCPECLGRGWVFIGDQVIECDCPGGSWVKLNAWELLIGFFMLIWGILFDKDLLDQGFTRIEFFKHGIQDLITYEVFVYD